ATLARRRRHRTTRDLCPRYARCARTFVLDSGFEGVEQRTVAVPLRLPSAGRALAMMQDAFGAYRAVVSDCPEAVRMAAWAEVAETLKSFEAATEFIAPAEVLVVAGVNRA